MAERDDRCQHFVRYGARCLEEGRWEVQTSRGKDGTLRCTRLCDHHERLDAFMHGAAHGDPS